MNLLDVLLHVDSHPQLLTEASLSTLAVDVATRRPCCPTKGLDQRKTLEGGGQRRQGGHFKPEPLAGVHPGKGQDTG